MTDSYPCFFRWQMIEVGGWLEEIEIKVNLMSLAYGLGIFCDGQTLIHEAVKNRDILYTDNCSGGMVNCSGE